MLNGGKWYGGKKCYKKDMLVRKWTLLWRPHICADIWRKGEMGHVYLRERQCGQLEQRVQRPWGRSTVSKECAWSNLSSSFTSLTIPRLSTGLCTFTLPLPSYFSPHSSYNDNLKIKIRLWQSIAYNYHWQIRSQDLYSILQGCPKSSASTFLPFTCRSPQTHFLTVLHTANTLPSRAF